jgi:hypothetical protein
LPLGHCYGLEKTDFELSPEEKVALKPKKDSEAMNADHAIVADLLSIS